MFWGVPKVGIEIRTIVDDGEGSTTVLWVSRHPPLKAQLSAMRMKLRRVRVVQVSGVVPNADYVIELARKYGARIIVPVLPLSFIARLVERARGYGITILFARMEAIAQVSSAEEARELIREFPEARTMTAYADGTIKIHEFKRFEVVKEVRLVTEPF